MLARGCTDTQIPAAHRPRASRARPSDTDWRLLVAVGVYTVGTHTLSDQMGCNFVVVVETGPSTLCCVPLPRSYPCAKQLLYSSSRAGVTRASLHLTSQSVSQVNSTMSCYAHPACSPAGDDHEDLRSLLTLAFDASHAEQCTPRKTLCKQ